MWSERERFLEEINKHLPRGVDWKLGATEYLRSLIKSEGSHNELYHFTRPRRDATGARDHGGVTIPPSQESARETEAFQASKKLNSDSKNAI